MSSVRAEEVLAAMPERPRATVDRLLRQAERWRLGVLLVGGPVRDYLLERGIRDVDLLVEPRRTRTAEGLARKAAPPDARVVSHERFGTVRIELGDAVVDIATTRRERYPHPGALPEVEPGSLEEDLRRRDFTVNALAVPLTETARQGRAAVVDPAGGTQDLMDRRLRVLHGRSFHDDPTRALRAARLAPRLGMALARTTRGHLRAALRDGAFGAVSGERFRAEIEKLFLDAQQGLDPVRALRLLADWHVLGALEPGLTLPEAAVRPLRGLGRLIAEPPWPALRPGRPSRPWVAGLMLWLAPLPAGLRRRALRRLAVRGELAGRILAFPTTREGCLGALERGRGRGAADAALTVADEETLLALAASAPSGLRRRIVRYAREDRCVSLPLDGTDLTAVGLSGPDVGRTLGRIRVAWLDRAVRDREEALALARELAKRAQRDSARRVRRRDRRGKTS